MSLQSTDHITDDFLKKLISQTKDDKLSEDFSDRVMAAIPVTKPEVESVEKLPVNWWQWALLAAAFAGVGYIIFSFDLFGRFNTIEIQQGNSLTNYVNMFSSIIRLFTDGFANFKFTTMPLTIILAVVVLFLGDKLLRKRMNVHVVML